MPWVIFHKPTVFSANTTKARIKLIVESVKGSISLQIRAGNPH